MERRAMLVVVVLAVLAGASAAAAQQPVVDTHCRPQAKVEGRASPYDSTAIKLGGATGRICYSRPSLRGRTMIGSPRVPYGKIWRTGANEPTTIHLPVAASIAGVRVPAGSYSIYTIPDPKEWTVIVNRSTTQWGIESQYPKVQAQEVGRGKVPAQALDAPVETFTIRATSVGRAGSDLVLEWEKTRIVVPIRVVNG